MNGVAHLQAATLADSRALANDEALPVAVEEAEPVG